MQRLRLLLLRHGESASNAHPRAASLPEEQGDLRGAQGHRRPLDHSRPSAAGIVALSSGDGSSSESWSQTKAKSITPASSAA
jgi:hypothetical protein